ncbi:2,3-epoxybenzoyl-CoA dihydrolase [Streptomyces sp. WMMB 322]|uniref:2,3-epoxybenzoyl-CoA dihydrolase n=1 Tax=Streptomyces sp. WMMB 322 TaxID=1286821 RepID=UPI0006E3A9CA|nr:2,3-epoxybenzoyl-CoA dihydrolase [Streptomyces sp. WMMB 322]SCK45965.1 2,3-dihydro-2,3-dihydroxybenzoyl-CoA ring cleavage enzyme [Streptomyces sp. WMMB 322]
MTAAVESSTQPSATEPGVADAEAAPVQHTAPTVSFDTSPERYRHWKLETDGEIATLTLLVDQEGGIAPGYELKSNSYDLGVDIELHDAVQRLRFEYPQVKAVVITGGLERMFCAGANIKMLAQSTHAWKVNFCKFTNETRNGFEDATEHSGQTYIAAVNGTCAGGGYEIALACDQIVLVDDGSSAVALPEVPLLGVLPGTGGLTRVVDKRHVRKDRADVFATKSEGLKGATAVEWNLVDAAVPRGRFDEEVTSRAREAAKRSHRPSQGPGVRLTPLERTETGDSITYRHVKARLLRDRRRVEITVEAPATAPPADASAAREQGADYWPLALARELDDLILRLRTNELELGTWVFRTAGDADAVLAHDEQLDSLAGDWFVNEVRHYLKRTFKRLDVTSRSLVAMIEPGSCFAGTLLELALACDRQYMLAGVFEDVDPDAEPAALVIGRANQGAYPMGNGLTRLQSRFHASDEELEAALKRTGTPLTADDAAGLGLVTMALDDIDYEDELRIVLEERASLSPDALTGMEANHRFVGPESMETKIFGRLTAWQNWIFNRPNASGAEGALRRFGTGRRADFDVKRV